MIKLLRVDHRLLHGQVAMAWTQSLDSDYITGKIQKECRRI